MSERESGGTALIRPEPPSPEPPDAESRAVWGFADSGFAFTDSGELTFTGTRYPLAGRILPDFLPWAESILGVPLDPTDVAPSSYPPPMPERRAHPAFEQALASRWPRDRILEEPEVRLRHGHGHTQEEMWAVRYGRIERLPDLVVQPESEEEVSTLVELAVEHDVCLVPYGGGTNVTDALRCPPDERRSIVSVDMRRMNRVLFIDPDNRMARIEAGAHGREIAEQLARHGFTLGHEPDSFEFSTLGGWIATNASGMKKNRYGNIEDLVLDLTVVTPRGKLERPGTAPRESVGGDPARWLIGSEGRLGIVTSAVVKIFPLPERQTYGSVIFPDFESGLAFMRDVQESGVKPASIRLMDNLQFQFGQALKPERRGWARLESRLERLFVTRVKGFEVDRMAACTLLFEGGAREVRSQERSVYRLASRRRGIRGGGENGERGYALTFSIAYIRDFMMRHHVVAESFETAIPWSGALSLVDRVKQRLWQEHAKRDLPGRPFVCARVTQLYETGVCIYFYFGCYMKGVPSPSDVYAEMERAAREEILRGGGSLSHHHGVGKLRQAFLPEIFSEPALRWRSELERAIDPGNVFGCGN
ncbi:MAG: FAD-binding oxidoreductase [bacterium]